MVQHVITKTYDQLRGFSTDSIFSRPSYVADRAVNIQRDPDGTFSPRRGYQSQSSGIGGLGVSVYENQRDNATQDVCVSSDGNLYKKLKGTMTIEFNGTDRHEFVSFMIFVDPEFTSDTQTCNFDPYAVVSEEALVTDCISFLMQKLTVHTAVSIGTGSTTYSGVLAGFPLTAGSIVMTDGTLTIRDNSNGGFTGNIGAGTNSINYSTGAYTVTFSGVTGAVLANYRGTLQEQFLQPMGKGFDVSSPYLISSLITLLASVTGVTVTTTGQTNKPAAFIQITEPTIIANGKSVTLEWFYWEPCNRTVPITFVGLLAHIGSDEFQNATFAAYQDVIYIADPWDNVQKFDGQTVYRVGMPAGEAPTGAVGATGVVTAGDHTYYITYEQIDATGRLVQGALSDGITITVLAGEHVDLVVKNLLQGSGWNTNAAEINGVQAAVNTIIVEVPHSVRVGDIAYFIDSADVEQTRNVTAITANSITIDGSPVSVTDADDWKIAISNNLKINIWSTIVSGTTPYLVKTIANNSYQTTTDYTVNIADADLMKSLKYITPVRRPDPPPKVGVVFSFRNQLIFTRNIENDDYVWFSDPDFPEYVSQEILKGNNFIVPSNDDAVTGVGVAGSTLIIFKDKSIYSVNGDLGTSQFNVTGIAPGTNIGAVNHASIASVGGLLYFLNNNGVFAMSETTIFPTDKFGNPVPLTIMIDEIFRTTPTQINQQYRLKRATACNYTQDNQYLLFLPCEEEEGARFANNYSLVLAYDYAGKNWFEWTRINAAGGLYVTGNNLFWQDRRAKSGSITSNTNKQHRKYRLIDQVDHVTPIRVTWTSSWEDAGQPRVRKKFVRAALLFDKISCLYQLNRPSLCFSSYVDWNTGVDSTKSVITTRIEGKVWNIPPWDWTEWSGYQDTFITVPLKNGTVSKSMQLQLQLNQLNTTFNLQGFQLEIAPDFRKTIVR